MFMFSAGSAVLYCRVTSTSTRSPGASEPSSSSPSASVLRVNSCTANPPAIMARALSSGVCPSCAPTPSSASASASCPKSMFISGLTSVTPRSSSRSARATMRGATCMYGHA